MRGTGDITTALGGGATIRYASAPLSKSQSTVVQELPIAEFEKTVRQKPGRENFTWSEKTIGAQGARMGEATPGEFEETIGGLVICEGDAGFQVHTEYAIKKDTKITIYTGEVIAFDDLKTVSERLLTYGVSYTETHGVDAKRVGNVANFMQHLPRKEQLQDYGFASMDIQEKVATCNVAMRVGSFKGARVLYLYATRDIAPKEQLGWSYTSGADNGYWALHKLYKNSDMGFFDKDTGKLIPSRCYDKNITVRLAEGALTSVPRHVIETHKRAKQRLTLRCGDAEGKNEKERTLEWEELQLLLSNDLFTTYVDPAKLPLSRQALEEKIMAHTKIADLVVFKALVDSVQLINASGIANFKKNNYPLAIAELLQALFLAQIKKENANSLGSIYYNLGRAYQQWAGAEQNNEQCKPLREAALYLFEVCQTLCDTHSETHKKAHERHAECFAQISADPVEQESGSRCNIS